MNFGHCRQLFKSGCFECTRFEYIYESVEQCYAAFIVGKWNDRVDLVYRFLRKILEFPHFEKFI